MHSDRSTRWQRVQELIDGALELSSDQRSAFLEQQCEGDERLQREAARLLSACDRAAQGEGLLATPAALLAAPFISELKEHQVEHASITDRLNAALAGRYVVERELARGGMATVYIAHDVRHDRTVAIKVVEHHGHPGTGERFLREIRTAARLTHPHLLTVHDSGAADGLLYFVMPYVTGETLRARLNREIRLSASETQRLMRELAEALAYAHACGVVHRDLKPENVLLSDGHAVIADFGIAKALAVAASVSIDDDASMATKLSETNSMAFGTPGYMAPEQIESPAHVDHRTDLFALGLIAYEALTGRQPLRRSSPHDAGGHANVPLSDLFGSDIPPTLALLVTRLMAADPTARPQSALEVLRALDGVTHTRRRTHNVSLVLTAAVVLVLAASGYGLWRAGGASRNTRVAPAPIHTVAVLPFVNTGGAAEDEYLSDGLTDELALALARLPETRVAGRMSSYAFKGRDAAAQEIGRALDVAVIITGTIRRAGNRVRVSTQLVNAADGNVLWGDTYESGASNLFDVQDEFTRAIVSAVAPALGDEGVQRSLVGGRGTTDQEAYDLYLRGRYFYLERGTDNVNRAIDYFQRSIARDPSFARAHAGLALTYGVLPFYQPERADAAGELMAASAARALALDATLADAHIAAGGNADRLLDFAEAEARFRKALELEPSNVTAHHWYGFMLLHMGRTEEATAELRRAVQLDPLAKSAAAAHAGALMAMRRFPEALAETRRVLAIDSTFSLGLYVHGQVQAVAGAPDSAIVTLEKGLRLYPDGPWYYVPLLYAYAATDRWSDAERLRVQLRGSSGHELEAAFAELVFGNREPLVQLLMTREGRSRWYNVYGFGCSPLNDPLWEDARFRAAMRRLGIQPCPLARPWPIRKPPVS